MKCVSVPRSETAAHSRNSTSGQFRGPTTAPARRLCASANRCTGGRSHTYAVIWSRNTTCVLFRGVGRYIRARNTTRVVFRGVPSSVRLRNSTCVLFRGMCSAIWVNVSVCDVPICDVKSQHNIGFEENKCLCCWSCNLIVACRLALDWTVNKHVFVHSI